MARRAPSAWSRFSRDFCACSRASLSVCESLRLRSSEPLARAAAARSSSDMTCARRRRRLSTSCVCRRSLSMPASCCTTWSTLSCALRRRRTASSSSRINSSSFAFSRSTASSRPACRSACTARTSWSTRCCVLSASFSCSVRRSSSTCPSQFAESRASSAAAFSRARRVVDSSAAFAASRSDAAAAAASSAPLAAAMRCEALWRCSLSCSRTAACCRSRLASSSFFMPNCLILKSRSCCALERRFSASWIASANSETSRPACVPDAPSLRRSDASSADALLASSAPRTASSALGSASRIASSASAAFCALMPASSASSCLPSTARSASSRACRASGIRSSRSRTRRSSGSTRSSISTVCFALVCPALSCSICPGREATLPSRCAAAASRSASLLKARLQHGHASSECIIVLRDVKTVCVAIFCSTFLAHSARSSRALTSASGVGSLTPTAAALRCTSSRASDSASSCEASVRRFSSARELAMSASRLAALLFSSAWRRSSLRRNDSARRRRSSPSAVSPSSTSTSTRRAASHARRSAVEAADSFCSFCCSMRRTCALVCCAITSDCCSAWRSASSRLASLASFSRLRMRRSCSAWSRALRLASTCCRTLSASLSTCATCRSALSPSRSCSRRRTSLAASCSAAARFMRDVSLAPASATAAASTLALSLATSLCVAERCARSRSRRVCTSALSCVMAPLKARSGSGAEPGEGRPSARQAAMTEASSSALRERAASASACTLPSARDCLACRPLKLSASIVHVRSVRLFWSCSFSRPLVLSPMLASVVSSISSATPSLSARLWSRSITCSACRTARCLSSRCASSTLTSLDA
mmetsp:Transcript_17638/g.54733  ORF Transcript_17638/g.54733 Transcript_17638/m.54733 type:complete len:831 (+) Transcript_17638:831-3323(+)